MIDPASHSPVFSIPLQTQLQSSFRSHVSAAGGICLRSRPSRQPQSTPHFFLDVLNLSSIAIDVLYRKTVQTLRVPDLLVAGQDDDDLNLVVGRPA